MTALVPEPAGYAELLERLKARVRSSRVRAARAANSELLALYWSVGRDILDRQEQAGWGSRVIDRLAADLRAEFPDQRGWSRSNLHYMRALAAAWPDTAVVPQAVGQLPWGHVRVLLDKLSTRLERDWYAAAASEYGWSRDVLVYQVETRLAERVGSAPSNFAAALPAADSDLARQLVRDPYVFDHLALTEPVAERDLEQAMVDRLERTLLAFGHGMAFVGRQVRFDIDGDELVLDLLLFSVEQLRYVVIELKIGRFDPAYIGQLGTYVAVVDDRLRRPGRHALTVGILLCKGRNDTLVRYALAGAPAPLAVADYTYDTLPAQDRSGLPTAAELAAALDRPAPRASARGTAAAANDDVTNDNHTDDDDTDDGDTDDQDTDDQDVGVVVAGPVAMTGTEPPDGATGHRDRPARRAAGRGAGPTSVPEVPEVPVGQLSLLPGCLSGQDRAVLAFACAHHLTGRVADRAQPELGVSSTRYYQLLGRLLDRPEAADAAPALVGQLQALRDQRRRSRDRASRAEHRAGAPGPGNPPPTAVDRH